MSGETRNVTNPDGDVKQKLGRRKALACYQCRDRKIGCDKLYPCTNCCNRRKSEPCRYSPEAQASAFTQAQEIGRLRKQLRSLTELNRTLQTTLDDLQDENGTSCQHTRSLFMSPSSTECSSPAYGETTTRKHESIYFGAPSCARIIEEFSAIESGKIHKHFSRPLPRAVDIYAYQDAPSDRVPSLWPFTPKTGTLIDVLPDRDTISRCIGAVDTYSRTFGFPHERNADVNKDVERFLSDLETEAERSPSMLAFIFAIVAEGSLLVECHGKPPFRKTSNKSQGRTTDVYISAAKHALDLSSFMSRPTICAVETLLLVSSYLIDTGRFLDAYTLFGTTIRVAQALGLHRDPSVLPHDPSGTVCRKRQSLWWWILYVDTYFSINLGRPLGISAQGDCRPVEPLIQDCITSSNFTTILAKFTIICRQILATGNLSNAKIEHFTKLLLEFLFCLPESLQFSPQWLESQDTTPAWPISVQGIFFCMQVNTYVVLLNREWQDQKEKPTVASCLSSQATNVEIVGSTTPVQIQPPVAYSRVISSCRAILQAYLYLHKSASKALANWSINQSAYNAALILVTHMAETKDCDHDFQIMEDVYVSFEALANRDHQLGRPAGLADKMRESLRPYLTGEASDDGGAFFDPVKTEGVMSAYGMTLTDDLGFLDHVSSTGEYSFFEEKMPGIEGSADLIMTPQSQEQARRLSPSKNDKEVSSIQDREPISCQTAGKEVQSRPGDQKRAEKRHRDATRDESTPQVGRSKRQKHRNQKRASHLPKPVPGPAPTKTQKTSKHRSSSSGYGSKSTTKHSSTHNKPPKPTSQVSTEKRITNIFTMTPPEPPTPNINPTVDASTIAALTKKKSNPPNPPPPNRQLPATTRTPQSVCDLDLSTPYLPTAPTTNAPPTAATDYATAYDYFSVPTLSQNQSNDGCAVLAQDFAPQSNTFIESQIPPPPQQAAFNPTMLHGTDGIVSSLPTSLYPIGNTVPFISPTTTAPSTFFPAPAALAPISSTQSGASDEAEQWHRHQLLLHQMQQIQQQEQRQAWSVPTTTTSSSSSRGW